MKYNLCYAQSGGVTAVINASAAGVIDAAQASAEVGTVFGARNGILGVLEEELVDVASESPETLARLKDTPGGAFGSCRVKLGDIEADGARYRRLIDVFRAHNIRYFLYNGGNDSADTALKMSEAAARYDYDLVTVGVPKTIDNDLPLMDSSPGFGSVAKYVAVSTAETLLDVRSMSRTSTKVFVLEVMGRHAGWIAAAAGLAADEAGDPLLILTPEVAFSPARFVKKLHEKVARCGYSVVVVSEGLSDENGEFLSAKKQTDEFAHAQLGGVALNIAALVTDAGYKCHFGVADYLQRSARHIASAVDAEQAYQLGQAAVKLAVAGRDAHMPYVKRLSDAPYQWEIDSTLLSKVANQERKLPPDFYDADEYRITANCRRYLAPLIAGEAYPPYGANGLPLYAELQLQTVAKRLPAYAA